MLINSRDAPGNTPYVLAQINHNEKIINLLLKVVEQTGNQELILEQMIDVERKKKLQSSHIMSLVIQVLK